VLEHVTRKPRVFPEHNFGARALGILAKIELRENVRGGPTELQRCFGSDGFDVCHPANAVSTEDFFFLRHGLIERLNVRFAKEKLLLDFRLSLLAGSFWRGWLLILSRGCVHFVDFSMKGSATDAELFGSCGYV